jgi:hypothetical protein
MATNLIPIFLPSRTFNAVQAFPPANIFSLAERSDFVAAAAKK